jgi:hypothetical protein
MVALRWALIVLAAFAFAFVAVKAPLPIGGLELLALGLLCLTLATGVGYWRTTPVA